MRNCWLEPQFAPSYIHFLRSNFTTNYYYSLYAHAWTEMKTNKWQGAIATPNSIFPLFRQLVSFLYTQFFSWLGMYAMYAICVPLLSEHFHFFSLPLASFTLSRIVCRELGRRQFFGWSCKKTTTTERKKSQKLLPSNSYDCLYVTPILRGIYANKAYTRNGLLPGPYGPPLYAE